MKTSKFKMTEIGEIPADWDVKKLGECCINFNYGVGAEAIPYVSGRKYIRITDIDERSRKYKPDVVMASAFETDNSIVNDGDILVARTGASVGKSYCYDSKDGELVFAGFLMRFHPENINSKYVFLTTLIGRYAQWVASESARSGQPGINIQQLKSYQIPVPPLAEQKAIAEALSDVDELLAAMTTLIEKKRAIKQGAMQELLGMRNEGEGIGNEELGVRNCEVGAKKVPRRRLPGFSGEWVEKRFDECFIHIPSKAYQVQATSYLGGGMYDVVDQGQSDVVGYTNDSSRLFRVPYDGVIIFGDHTRVVKFRLKDFVVGADGTQLLIGRNADTRFLSLLLGLLKIPNLGYSRHFKYIKEGRYLLPPTVAEQRAIAEVLSDMDAEIEALEAKRAKYESIKQGMTQELLTGKIRLV